MSKPFAIPSIHLGHILLPFSLLQKQLLYFLLFSLYFYGVISMYTFLFACYAIIGTEYSRMDLVKFLEDSL